MPITYTIDEKSGVILESWQGTITADDLAAYWRGLLADPAAMALRRTVADLRRSRLAFSGAELMQLVDEIATPRLAGSSWKTAIIVDTPDQFGVSRQYQVYAEHYSRDAIFHDPDAALRWVLTD